jgi:hypothetical protein
MKDIGEPERVLAGFAPELWGQPLDEGDVLDTQVLERDGLTYYRYIFFPNAPCSPMKNTHTHTLSLKHAHTHTHTYAVIFSFQL